MAKSLKVERLRGLDINVTPNIRTVDTYAPPAAADTRNRGTQLVNFISQLSPQLQDYKKKQDAARDEAALAQVADMNHIRQEDGSYKSFAEMGGDERSLAAYNAYTLAVGKLQGHNVATSVDQLAQQGLRDGTLSSLSPQQFEAWMEKTTQEHLLGLEDKTNFNQPGFMKGVKENLVGLDALSGAHMTAHYKYQDKQIAQAIENQLISDTAKTDWTDAEDIVENVATATDAAIFNNPNVSKTGVNKARVDVLINKINNAQSRAQVVAIQDAAYMMSQGKGGTVAQTAYYKARFDEVSEKAYKRIEELEKRFDDDVTDSENNAKAELTDYIIEQYKNGRHVDDYVLNLNEWESTGLNDAELNQLKKNIHSQISETGTVSEERYYQLREKFEQLQTPREKQALMHKLVQSGELANGAERNVVTTIINAGTGRKNVSPNTGADYKLMFEAIGKNFGYIYKNGIIVDTLEKADAPLRDAAFADLESTYIGLLSGSIPLEDFVSENKWGELVKESIDKKIPLNLQLVLEDPYAAIELRKALTAAVLAGKLRPGLLGFPDSSEASPENKGGKGDGTSESGSNNKGDEENYEVWPPLTEDE